jgi:ubiquinone/menaquinone biosynthesis C-methylase UbiE
VRETRRDSARIRDRRERPRSDEIGVAVSEVGDVRESRHFDSIALEYEERIGLTSRAAEHKIRRLSSRFARWLQDAPEGPLLEIGAGTGFLTRHLAPQVPDRHYLASDFSAGMVDAALRAPGGSANVEWVQADCLNLRNESAAMACVVGHGILHHLPLEAAVVEFSRVLKPGGRIAFYEPNIVNPIVFLEKKVPLFRPKTDTPGETGLLASTVRKSLRRNGFGIVLVTPCEFVLNQVPSRLVPIAEQISGSLEQIPVVRQLGGSLRILAVKA